MTIHYPIIPKIHSACRKALRYISLQQQENGGFLASTGQPVTFYASLILCALEHCEDEKAVSIKSRGSAFLLREKNPDWSFRYWQKDSAQASEIPYPSDLDDTFAALKALSICRPETLTEKSWHAIVALLLENEQAPGGPYQTWCLPDRSAAWHDVDIVVNSSIASFLLRFDIFLPGLQDFFDAAIASGDLRSKYYHDDITILHFLSKAYCGSNSSALKNLLLQLNDHGVWSSPFSTALAVTALLFLGEPADSLHPAIEYILASETNGTWPDEPFFIESRQANTLIYSTCSAYVSACCIEALGAYERALLKNSSDHGKISSDEKAFVARVTSECKQRLSGSSSLIRAQLDRALHMLAAKDPRSEVMLLSYKLFQHGATQHKDKSLSCRLAAATTLGWIGYTVIDKTLDGEKTIEQLPFAIKCIRESANMFQSIAGDRKAVTQDIFDDIENAVLWEHGQCSLAKNGTALMLPKILPSYGNYAVLAEKSLGFALPAIVFCYQHGDHVQAKIFEQFFRHYLIARQLNDDAHDWLEDLQNGFLNSISIDIVAQWQCLKNTQEINIEKEEDILQALFWETGIDAACADIARHCRKARAALRHITVLADTDFLKAMIAPLEQSATRAISERDKARAFLAAM